MLHGFQRGVEEPRVDARVDHPWIDWITRPKGISRIVADTVNRVDPAHEVFETSVKIRSMAAPHDPAAGLTPKPQRRGNVVGLVDIEDIVAPVLE